MQSPGAISAAGLFLTGTKKQQQFIKVGTLVRLQPNTTVRSVVALQEQFCVTPWAAVTLYHNKLFTWGKGT